MKRISTLTAFLIAGLLLLSGQAAASDHWLHVRVQDGGDDGESVHVNLPLTMVSAFLPALDLDDDWGHSGIDIRTGRVDGIDLRELFLAIQDSPDTDFVTVRSRDENVRVAKRDGLLEILVEDQGHYRPEVVRISLPMEVVEALVGGSGSLDLAAGLERLAEMGGGDLVTVDSGDESVRVWIDTDQYGDR